MAATTTTEVGLAPASLWFGQRVKTKLAMGTYHREPVACFCGSTSAQPVTKTDRHGLDHAIWLCLECGLIYANPRFTTASAAEFQQYELPHLTDPLPPLDRDDLLEEVRENYLRNPSDLIILHHTLQHATDLETTLRRVHAVLPEQGLLYVSVPGLYAQELSRMVTIAEPWYFTAETLAYVMECCGFEELRCNEHIVSLWTKVNDVRLRSDRPTTNVRYIADYLFSKGTRLVPILRTSNKFKLADRRAAIASATSRGLPEITDLIRRYHGGSAVIIGGGPSVDGSVEKIRQLQASGSKILCIERMYPWCQQHGIIPEYVVAQDASPDVVESFECLSSSSIFLLSSQCQPAVFDALAGRSVYFFHTLQRGIAQTELTGPTTTGVQVNSGGSVVLCAMSLAMLLGLGDLHVFGFDCHLTNGGYANGITGVGEQTSTMQISIEDRIFTTTPAYLSFAQQFFHLKDMGEKGGLLSKVTVYGDSLVTAMCDAIPRGTL